MNNMAFMRNLGILSEVDRKSQSTINAKKLINKTIKKSREEAKTDKCFYCGKKVDSFCNSHSIPAFCLRNIAIDGEVLTPNSIIKIPVVDEFSGIKSAGTFRLICRECDSKVFSDYENPNNYKQKPTNIMLSQIALKNNVKAISKRWFESFFYKNSYEIAGIFNNDLLQREYVTSLDLKEYIDDFNKAKKSLQKFNDEYYMCYYKKLDYVVPIACQIPLALIFDFNGNVINNIYNQSPNYKIKNIHINIFPLNDSSVIFLFINDGDKRYRNFYKQFNKLPLEEQLKALTFIIFAYSEDVFFSKKILTEVNNSPELTNAAQSDSGIISFTTNFSPLEKCRENFDLSLREKVPNLLSEKYKIK